jgi:hypothetical protein
MIGCCVLGLTRDAKWKPPSQSSNQPTDRGATLFDLPPDRQSPPPNTTTGHHHHHQNPGGKQVLTGPELADLYKDLAAKYPIVSIEDPFDQVRCDLALPSSLVRRGINRSCCLYVYVCWWPPLGVALRS